VAPRFFRTDRSTRKRPEGRREAFAWEAEFGIIPKNLDRNCFKSCTMKYAATGSAFTLLIGLFLLLSATAPAEAISADLANKCREMAIHAYPPKVAGSKTGSAAEERSYFRSCISNNGSMPEDEKNTSTPPPK
jgi:hypothetical protein